jgi:hypothetical protein
LLLTSYSTDVVDSVLLLLCFLFIYVLFCFVLFHFISFHFISFHFTYFVDADANRYMLFPALSIPYCSGFLGEMAVQPFYMDWFTHDLLCPSLRKFCMFIYYFIYFYYFILIFCYFVAGSFILWLIITRMFVVLFCLDLTSLGVLVLVKWFNGTWGACC